TMIPLRASERLSHAERIRSVSALTRGRTTTLCETDVVGVAEFPARRRIQVALEQIAAESDHRVALCDRLDAFTHEAHAEFDAQLEHGAHDGNVRLLRRESAREHHVELHDVRF